MLEEVKKNMELLKNAQKDVDEAKRSLNSIECRQANTIIALAKKLKEEMAGVDLHRLISELITITNWKPPTTLTRLLGQEE